MTVVFLSACGDKNVNDVEDNTATQINEENTENVGWDTEVENTENVENNSEYVKTSLTAEDLDQIDETSFPVSYEYEVYRWEDESTSDAGSYTYPEGVDHKLLLPIHADMVSREVISSWIEDWMIYTMVNATLKDESVVSILYINDPVTLQYIAASVNNDMETTLYSFAY